MNDVNSKCYRPLHYTVFCNALICDIVHCEWNEWIIGECSKSCGGGTRVNERTEKVTAQHGGDKCPGPTSIEESCNVQECPGKRCPIGFQF